MAVVVVVEMDVVGASGIGLAAAEETIEIDLMVADDEAVAVVEADAEGALNLDKMIAAKLIHLVVPPLPRLQVV